MRIEKGIQKVTAITYTSRRDFNKGILRFLTLRDVLYDVYVIFYGSTNERIYTKYKTVYLNTPYSRGSVFHYGSVLAYTPITIYLNLESRCFKKKFFEEAIEGLIEGSYSLYLAIPLTTNSLLNTYREKVYKLLKELGFGLKLVYPSYTFVIGKSRIFKDSPHTLWSSEILAALLVELAIGGNRVTVVNDGCNDDVPFIKPGIEKLYMERLALDIIAMLVNRRVIDEKKGKELIEMVKSG